MDYVHEDSRRSARRKWVIVAVCLAAAVLVICGLAYGLLALLKSSDAYKGAVARAKDHPAVAAELGTPVREGWYLTGNIHVSGPSGNADLAIPLSGPKGEGTLFAVATRSAGQWSFTKLVFRSSAGQRIDLLAGGQPGQKE